MMTFLIICIVVAILYGIITYNLQSQSDQKLRDRLADNPFEPEENADADSESIWSGADDLIELASINERLNKYTFIRKLSRNLEVSGFKISATKLLFLAILIAFLLSLVIYLFAGRSLFSFVPIGISPFVAIMLINMLAERRRKKFDGQLPAFISQMLTTLRSGSTPMQSLQNTAINGPEPIRTSVSQLIDTLKLGVSPGQAWREWSEFWGTKSAHLVSTGIRLKWETGGQMAAILTHILDSLEFTRRMELRVDTVTAQAKLSSYILIALPFGLATVMYLSRPEPIDRLWLHPTGRYLFYIVGGLIAVGYIWLRKVAKLED
ncbi:MAG: hypothetical protein HOP21_06610 [Methylotenera sp.]|nr:hypothetical protein [Methylotenera sp.]